MKHIPILGKFLSIIALFALFCVGTTYFTTLKMRLIDDTYSDVIDQQGLAGVALSRSSRAAWGMRTSIAELTLATTDAGNQTAENGFKLQHDDFLSYIDAASAALPANAAKFTALKQATLQAVEGSCAEARRLGKATEADAVLKAQAVYMRDCGPAIAEAAAAIRSAVDDLLKETRAINDATTDV